jgi:hypothetical protein
MFDEGATRDRYRLLNDKNVYLIANSKPGTFLPEAIALAKEELISRGINESGTVEIVNAIHADTIVKSERTESLFPALKFFCLLLPVAAIFIAFYYFLSRQKRKMKEALVWGFYGIIVRIVIWFLQYFYYQSVTLNF